MDGLLGGYFTVSWSPGFSKVAERFSNHTIKSSSDSTKKLEDQKLKFGSLL